MSLIDHEQRIEATNPLGSYIVQAPAGSGKTEILTQRYLRLLGTVQNPEQIVALTFTRKAASEMRERIFFALEQAEQKVQANSPHQQMTLQFAADALERSASLNWNLLSQPNRMRITTIDSLCQSINQSIPLIENHLSYAQITDKSDSFYLNAARNCIEMAMQEGPYQEAIKTLLLHVDNRQDKLVSLFQSLLAQRDQWLAPLFQAKNQDKSIFESALKHIETHEIQRLRQSLPVIVASQLVELARDMAMIEKEPHPKRSLLKQWFDFQTIDQNTSEALSALILKTDLELRASFDHHVGLKKDVCSPGEYTQIKERSKILLNQLRDYPDFVESLIQVSTLPKPHYDLEQWEVLQALFTLLPLLVSHLNVLFAERNEVDFTAISQSALAALGDEDEPTDLALYLDHAIHHLLVDEFRDTSISQFELIYKLVQGWLPGDGRTLFLVGDPMQSIYRFRQAEVGLFYQVQEQGIGPVRLNLLQLSCNFRSTQTIIDWVNQHFRYIFPTQFDIETGAVSFHASVHVLKNNPESAVQAFQYANRNDEAQELIALVKKELASGSQRSIAISVRSRSHLPAIIRLLRAHHIPYQGSDIDLLSNLPHVNDLWSLTQALLFPANRLAWFSLLRSPLVGLSLEDLHHIALHRPHHSIFQSLLNDELTQSLSQEGQIRAKHAAAIMNRALAQRHHQNLSTWVEWTFKQFQGELLITPNQKNDVEQFFRLLDAYESHGRIEDRQSFEKELNNLYAQQSTPSPLQVMTIHKSKGLEFDTVILPSLGAQPNRGDKPLLRWLKLPTQDQNILLISPIHAAHDRSNPLYDYLGQIDNEKASYEAQRLLYVAVTRAKSRLILLDGSTKNAKGSFKTLLKHQVFESVHGTQDDTQDEASVPKLRRIPITQFANHPIKSMSGITEQPPNIQSNPHRMIGIVIHQLLQWICDNHPQALSEIPWSLAEYQFRQLGFADDDIANAMNTVTQQIGQLFQDTIGQWIIKKHQNEHNEYELLINHQNQITTRIIDRTFIADGVQWVIDFKTGKDNPDALESHQKQLNEYAQLLRSITQLPIHCGLYYLEHTRWVDWVGSP